MSLWLGKSVNILPYSVRGSTQNHLTINKCFCYILRKSTPKAEFNFRMSLLKGQYQYLISLWLDNLNILPCPVRDLSQNHDAVMEYFYNIPSKSTSKEEFDSLMSLWLEGSLNILCFSESKDPSKIQTVTKLCCSAFVLSLY